MALEDLDRYGKQFMDWRRTKHQWVIELLYVIPSKNAAEVARDPNRVRTADVWASFVSHEALTCALCLETYEDAEDKRFCTPRKAVKNGGPARS